MSELPAGWVIEKLVNITERITKGSTPTSYGFKFQDHGIPFVKIENIRNGIINHSSIKCFISEKANENQKRSILEERDILFSIAGTLGVICIVKNEDIPANTNQALAVIRGTHKFLHPDFLRYQLESNVSKEQINRQARGGGMNNLSLSDVRNMDVLIPPHNEQCRIVAKLEKLLQKVDACKEWLDKIPAILKRFRQSVLAAACSGRLTAYWRDKNLDVEPATELLKRIQSERKKAKKQLVKNRNILQEESFDIPDSWAFCFFEDIAANKPNSLKAGPFGSSLTKSCYVPSGYKIYGQEQVIRGDHSYGDYYIDEEKFLALKTCEVQAGDILVSLVGTIGKVLIIPDIFEKGIINPRLIKITLLEEVSRKYIARFLSSTLAMNTLSKGSHGGTMDILNMRMLKNLPIPLPPIDEQEEIVRRVEALFKIADQIEERYKKARTYVDKLTQSILVKAFRGELVPQDPNDEAASELLKRIQKEKDKQTKKREKKVKK